jgi:hypothetical protein
MRPNLFMPLVLCLSVGACESGSSDPLEQQAKVPDDATPLALEPLFTDLFGGITDGRRLVIRSAEEWNAFWEEVTRNRIPEAEAPEVDFEGYMVIAAAMGQRPTGGYTIAIDEVSQSEGEIYAVVREVSAAPGCPTTGVFTAPVTAVRVPRSDDPVTFVEREDTRHCG